VLLDPRPSALSYRKIDEPDPTAEADLLEAQANYFVNACRNAETPAPCLEDHILLSHLDRAIRMPSPQDWPLWRVKCKVMVFYGSKYFSS
jgi:hypothetical protein